MLEAVTWLKVLGWILVSQTHLPIHKAAEFASCVVGAAIEHNIEPSLIAAVIQHESGWREDARSRTSDSGLGQINDRHYNKLGKKLLFDGCTNINETAKFLATRGLSAYNPGNSSHKHSVLAKKSRLERAWVNK